MSNLGFNKKIAVCASCDMLLEDIETDYNTSTFCPRCGHRIYSQINYSLDKTLSLSLTGIILYFPAVLLPLVTMDTLGMEGSGTILDSIVVLYDSGFYLVAVMVFLTAIFFPLLKLISMFTVSLLLKFRIKCRCLYLLLRTYMHIDEWGMPEVYMIGLLVTIIKMYPMSSIEYNTGFFCFAAFMLITLMLSVCIDPKYFWDLMEITGVTAEKKSISLETCLLPDKETRISDIDSLYAMKAGIAVCHDCHKILCLGNRKGEKTLRHKCYRCGARVHYRKPRSIEHTWALVVTAIILFLPANMLPMMKVDYLGVPQYSTILDGIIYFFEDGAYGIGVVILTASILVPLFKIVGIMMILLSIHFKWKSWLKHKALMFRFIEFVGRWSMLDIFVVALLQAIVNFGFLTSIEAASAATYFTGVVVFTMFAAISFDPRLLWDAVGTERES